MIDKEKYLGVAISEDLKLENHINNICGKANRTLNFLCHNLNIDSTSVKDQAYQLLVRHESMPVLYGISILNPT